MLRPQVDLALFYLRTAAAALELIRSAAPRSLALAQKASAAVRSAFALQEVVWRVPLA